MSIMLHNPLLADRRGGSGDDPWWEGHMQMTRNGAGPQHATGMQHRFSPAATCSQNTSDDEEVRRVYVD